MNSISTKPDVDAHIGKPMGMLLSSQLILGLAVLIALILVVSSGIIWFKARPLLEDLGLRSRIQQGRSVTLALEQEVANITGIARSMAALSKTLPHDPESFQRVLPAVLDQMGSNSLIAGGGYWPEPNKFLPGVVRSSFFWGRAADGQLQSFADYNDPAGPGYHNEEWYVPARWVKPSEVYWSKSYTDPYSMQSIVTCTAPIFDKGEFVGAATVDLRLEMVSRILDQMVNGLEAYAFVVDRNNKFIAYPYPDRIITRRFENGSEKPDYIYVSELADIQPSFANFAEHLSQLEARKFAKIASKETQFNSRVGLLEKSSYQIDNKDARNIAAYLLGMSNSKPIYPQIEDRFDLDRDSILAERATAIIFNMQATDWKVITVFRKSVYMRIADTVSRDLMLYIAFVTLLFGLIAYIILRTRIISPVRGMVEQLYLASAQPKSKQLKLHYHKRDELGLLAFWFNQHSRQLEIARNQADKANAAKTAFLAKVSHELRTPLNSIIGFSRRLLKKLDGSIDEFHFEALQRIHSNGKHLQELISDILDMTAIESGATHLHMGWSSVKDILYAAHAEVSLLAQGKNLNFTVYPLDTDKQIYCDKNRVIQILVQLLKNAIKATNGGYVRMRAFETERKPGYMCFEVHDDGIGISEYDQKKLFQQFTQIDDNLGAEKGTGLGLYLVAEFLALHNGEITVSSKIGEGSIFTAYIPIDGPGICQGDSVN